MTTDNTTSARYTGEASTMFWLAFKTAILTALTLGIYRFWAKTRIRRHVWSSTEIDGSRFEYTGTGLEKFIGFLVAVVILAVYVGLVQLIAMFLGISLLSAPTTQAEVTLQGFLVLASILFLVPVYFFAVYRARRYRLARTRWRGIRFAMEKGGWGYAARAIWYNFLTIVSFGLLLPLATFRLEKYMTDRSWFGDHKFEQQGRWVALYRAMAHVFVGVAIVVASTLLIAFLGSERIETIFDVLLLALFILGLLWFAFGWVYFAVRSFGYLASHKALGDEIAFSSTPRTWVVIGISLGGTLAIAVISIVLLFIAAQLFGLSALVAFPTPGDQEFALPSAGLIVAFALTIYLVLTAVGALVYVLVLQPLIAHYVNATSVVNLAAVSSIAQREGDHKTDAEGFADAFDVGGAI